MVYCFKAALLKANVQKMKMSREIHYSCAGLLLTRYFLILFIEEYNRLIHNYKIMFLLQTSTTYKFSKCRLVI